MMGEILLESGPTGGGVDPFAFGHQRDQFVEGGAQPTDFGRDDLRQRAAPGAEDGGAARHRLDEGHPERLVPERRHPGEARIGEQLRLGSAADLAEVAHARVEGGAPRPGDAELPVEPLCACDRPVIALHRVQPPQKEIELLLDRAEDHFGRVYAVMDPAAATVALGVISAEVDRLWRSPFVGAPIAVQHLDPRHRRGRVVQLHVREEELRAGRKVGFDLEAAGRRGEGDRHERRFRDRGTGSGEQRDRVSPRRESADLVHGDPLGAAIALHREDRRHEDREAHGH